MVLCIKIIQNLILMTRSRWSKPCPRSALSSAVGCCNWAGNQWNNYGRRGRKGSKQADWICYSNYPSVGWRYCKWYWNAININGDIKRGQIWKIIFASKQIIFESNNMFCTSVAFPGNHLTPMPLAQSFETLEPKKTYQNNKKVLLMFVNLVTSWPSCTVKEPSSSPHLETASEMADWENGMGLIGRMGESQQIHRVRYFIYINSFILNKDIIYVKYIYIYIKSTHMYLQV